MSLLNNETVYLRQCSVVVLALSISMFDCNLAIAQSKSGPSKASTQQAKPAAAAFAESSLSILLEQSRVLRLNGNLGQAEAKSREALSLSEKSGNFRLAAGSACELAECLAAQDKIADEEAVRRQALQFAEKGFGAASPEKAEQEAHLGGWHARKGETANAWACIERSTASLEGKSATSPGAMSACYLATARVQTAEKNMGLADESYQKAINYAEKKNGEKSAQVLFICKEYAEMLEKLKRSDEAAKLKDRVSLGRALSASSGTPDSKSTLGAQDSFARLSDQARAAQAKGDTDQAIASWKLALADVEKKSAKDPRIAYGLVHLGDLYVLKKQNDEAMAVFKKAFAMREELQATSTLGAARNLNRMVMVNFQQGKQAAAEPLLWRQLEILDKCGASPAASASCLGWLVSSCALSKSNRTEEVCKRLIKLSDEYPEQVPAYRKTTALGMLGSVYMQSGRMQDGMELMKKIQVNQSPEAAAQMTRQSAREYEQIEKEAEDAELASFR